MSDDLAAFGAPKELIAEAEQKRAESEKPFEVFKENWPTVQIFLKLSTQWNLAGMGELIGLNYQSVEFLFRLYKVKKQTSVFEGIRMMELAALAAIRRSKEKRGNSV